MSAYLFPRSVKEAVACLETYGGAAQIIAGGTDLMADIRTGKKRPRCLVDITRIPGLDQIQVTEGFVKIGAAVTFAALKADPFVRQYVHALADAARSVGAPGIQNAATWGGNIVQGMPAADGADIALALEVEAYVVETGGAAWRPVASLFRGPGLSVIDPTRQLITHFRFPRPRGAWGTAWSRIGRRPSLVLPILNCAVQLRLNGETSKTTHAVVALGPVAPRPFRARETESFLRGKSPDEDTFAQAARITQGEANPRSSVMRASKEYRRAVIPTLVRDTLNVAAQRARTHN